MTKFRLASCSKLAYAPVPGSDNQCICMHACDEAAEPRRALVQTEVSQFHQRLTSFCDLRIDA